MSKMIKIENEWTVLTKQKPFETKCVLYPSDMVDYMVDGEIVKQPTPVFENSDVKIRSKPESTPCFLVVKSE